MTMTQLHEARATISVRMAIAGNVIERYDTNEVLHILGTRLAAPDGCALAVGSVNLDHLHHFGKEGELCPKRGLDWLLLADGMPIAWRGQALTGQPWPRVTGADFLPEVLRLAERGAYRVGFLGGTPESHRLLAERLSNEHPDLAVAGMWAPEPDELTRRSPELARAIREADVEILVVSLGKPKQERWVAQYGRHTGARVLLPFGAAADFLAGTQSRAPGWMRRVGLEWLYRLSREPRRLARRYLIQGPMALVQAFRAEIICAPGVYYAGGASEQDPGRMVAAQAFRATGTDPV